MVLVNAKTNSMQQNFVGRIALLRCGFSSAEKVLSL